MQLLITGALGVLSFLFSSLLTRSLIPILRKKKMGQSILEIGPFWHRSKEGTPTMGGIVFLLIIPPLTFAAFLLSGKSEGFFSLILVLLYMIANGMIGVLDDRAKFKNQKNEGLLPWQKLVLQSIISFAFLYFSETHLPSLLPLHLPFGNIPIEIGFAGYFILLLLMVGTVNCANLTDGIDGLAGSVSFILSLFFAAEGIVTDNHALLSLGSVSAFCLIGFLLFNRHPAKIFMGDTGSLFLGALAIGGAILLKRPLSVVLFGAIYMIEGVSVILQVIIFKRTGKRLFLMAPLHHHFEKKGWSENKIVIYAVLLTAGAAFISHFIAS